MATDDYTEDQYYTMIDDCLNHPVEVQIDNRTSYPMNFVAGPAEWKNFKRALLRWLAEQEAEHIQAYDQAALEQEHDDDEV